LFSVWLITPGEPYLWLFTFKPDLKTMMSFLIQGTLFFLLESITWYFPAMDNFSNNRTATVDQLFSSAGIDLAKRVRPNGYRAVGRFEDGFLAVGSGGRVDRISKTGEIIQSEVFPGESFNCLLSVNQLVIIAGDKGTIFLNHLKCNNYEKAKNLTLLPDFDRTDSGQPAFSGTRRY
jgi:hypothetical protein